MTNSLNEYADNTIGINYCTHLINIPNKIWIKKKTFLVTDNTSPNMTKNHTLPVYMVVILYPISIPPAILTKAKNKNDRNMSLAIL